MLLLISILLILDSCTAVNGSYQYYVKSSDNQSYGSGLSAGCHTLPYYVANSNTYFTTSSTTFTFLAGRHLLNTTLSFSDIDTLTLEGSVGMIQCTGQAGLMFNNITSLHIKGMMIIQCSMELTPSFFNNSITTYGRTFLQFTVNVWAGVFMNYITDLHISNTTIANSLGYGLLGVNLLGDTLINQSNFSQNNHEMLSRSDCFLHASLTCKGGNMMLLYTDLLSCPISPKQYTLSIHQSIFEGGVDAGVTFQPFTTQSIYRNDLELLGGAGIGLIYMQSSYGVRTNITSCVLNKNAAFVGANLYINMWDYVDNTTITIANSSLVHGNNYERFANLLEIAGSYTMAPGYFFLFGMISLTTSSYSPVCGPSDRKYEAHVFQLFNSSVSYNVATLNSGGFMYAWPRSFLQSPRYMTLDRVTATGNNGDATFINFYMADPRYGLNFKVFVQNCIFDGNFYIKQTNGLENDNPQVYLVNSVQFVQYTNCTWSNNDISSVRSLQSIVHFKGTNRFYGNRARTGAAINIREGTMVYFDSNSTTIFENNFATQYGGAIYAALSSYVCFYQLESTGVYPRLVFNSNKAVLAGDAVYSNIENCLLQEGIYTEDALSIFAEISEFSNDSINSTSLISAPASRLCPCNGSGSNYNEIVNCNENILQLQTRPGQSFKLFLEGRSSFNPNNSYFGPGLTPTEVTANVIRNTSYARLGNLQSTQSISSQCSELTYALYSSNHGQVIEVVLSPQNLRLYTPLVLNVTLLPCPVGFVLSNESLECVCEPVLSDNGVSCNSETLTIVSPIDVWIGTLNTTNPPLVAYGSCQTFFDYCNDELIPDLTLNNTDVQCIEHRSGVLCGECSPGYSLAIGSTNCLECSNNYLALLIVFVLSGLVLIAFLSFFNITVSTGRINAMLFFANVIKLSNFKFFTLSHPGFAIFQIFIDWINLDFGIETCFYNGFDMYTKVWLQFVYLLYLYIILIVIVVSAQYSTRISKIVPKNILGVVTTVVLITFVKLLRISSAIFPFITIDTSEGDVVVWSLDGNVIYFSDKHLPLFLFSLLVTCLVIIPGAVLLLLYPFIWSFSAHEGTFFEKFVCFVRDCIVKIKPFLETFDGPYAATSRYWTGLLLLLRLVIFYTALTVPTNTTSGLILKTATVTIICIVLLGLVIAFKIFNCPINKRVEFAHLLNLAIVQFVILILTLSNQSDTSQGIALSLSIVIAFLIFVYSVVFENWNSIKKPYYRVRGKTFVDTRAEQCHIAARERDMEFNKQQDLNNLDSTMRDQTEFFDVLDARKTVTRSSVSYVNSAEDKLEQLRKELMYHK